MRLARSGNGRAAMASTQLRTKPRRAASHVQRRREPRRNSSYRACVSIQARQLRSSLSRKSDGFLEILGGAEGDFLARLDLDRLAGRRIASHAGRALAHLQDAEAGHANA